MKKKIHPDYQDVLFVDSSTGYRFVCGSTLKPSQTEIFEGIEYPVHVVSVSSASHPFFTGSKQFIDAEGRVDKFSKKYQKKKELAKKNLEDQEKQKLEEKSKKKKPAKAAPKPKAKKTVQAKVKDVKIEENPNKKVTKKAEKK